MNSPCTPYSTDAYTCPCLVREKITNGAGVVNLTVPADARLESNRKKEAESNKI